MNRTLPEFSPIRLRNEFGRSSLALEGEEHGPLLDSAIRQRPENAVIAVDLRGLEYLGYSYAKATVRAALLRRIRGEYEQRQILLVSDQGDAFLDGLVRALRDKKLFMAVLQSLDSPLAKADLIGDVPGYIKATFKELARTAPVSTGSLARALGESAQNTKNRLDRLQEMGLLKREKVASPTGGLEWLNWICG